MLENHFKSFQSEIAEKGRTVGFYGIFLEENSIEQNGLIYDGSYVRKDNMLGESLERVSHHINTIAKAFYAQDFSFLHTKTQRPMYMKLFATIVQANKSVQFHTIKELPYPGTVIESAFKIAQLNSERAIFPHMINLAIDIDVDSDELSYIFSTNADIPDFANFIVYNLINNIQRSFITLNRTLTGENGFCSVKGRYFMGGLFKMVKKKDLPENHKHQHQHNQRQVRI